MTKTQKQRIRERDINRLAMDIFYYVCDKQSDYETLKDKDFAKAIEKSVDIKGRIRLGRIRCFCGLCECTDNYL